jgi:hypothetical protein
MGKLERKPVVDLMESPINRPKKNQKEYYSLNKSIKERI